MQRRLLEQSSNLCQEKLPARSSVTLTIDRLFIRGEEENLAAHFGPAYTDYARRVRRWL